MSGLSLDLEKENIEKLKELFPAAVEEGKINFDMLRILLGDEVDDSREKYQFTWNGKAKAIKLAQTPSSATLRPCKGKSKDWDKTENIYIEGDNLEVLKQLQKTYYGKIKIIYIDPPYNTGNDFVYRDDFKNSLENYKQQTNQSYSSNPESNGRFHTDWLNMIYPRLLLAKNLLREDGAIFVSIDEHEHANLISVMQEIFGETNYIDSIVWDKKASAKGVPPVNMMVNVHEYIVAFQKSKKFTFTGEKRSAENDGFKNPDHDPRGPWRESNIKSTIKPMSEAFTITDPNTGKQYTNTWAFSKESLERMIKENRILWKESLPKQKEYLGEMTNENKAIKSDWGVFDAQSTTVFLKHLLPNVKFDNPKPINLMQYLISVSTKPDDIIMDFFSGSGTTAHACMKQNVEDGGLRKYILVQLPEKCSLMDGKMTNICEIGEKRIDLSGEIIKSEWTKKHPSDTLFSDEEQFTTDIGFKIFKLDSSNVNEWDSSLKLDEKELAERLGEVFKSGRSKEDILYEVMLKYGVFDRQVEEIDINGKTMYRVGKRYMIVCLEDNINSSDIKAIGELSPRTVIFKESGFIDDNAKLNAVYNLEKAGVEDIKCI